MSAFLVVIAIAISARLSMKLALRINPDAFKNPGGWKLPLGEVMVLASVLATIVAIGALYRWVYL